MIQKALRTIQQRHDKTYTNALEKFEKFKPQLDKLLEDSARNLPFLWLDSYTYPTRIIKAVEVSKNEPADRTILTFALTTMAALFISIMLAFLIEGIRNRIEEEKYE